MVAPSTQSGRRTRHTRLRRWLGGPMRTKNARRTIGGMRHPLALPTIARPDIYEQWSLRRTS
jgi:hypothetical protein